MRKYFTQETASNLVFGGFLVKNYSKERFKGQLRVNFCRRAAGTPYRALKAFGQIPKSLFILQVIDDPVLRQAIEKQMDRIEHVHRFTRAVSEPV